MSELSPTEQYWDATEVDRSGFTALLKFNFGEDVNGYNYIIVIDGSIDAKRFYAGTKAKALKVYSAWLDDNDSGLNSWDLYNHYDNIVEREEE